MPFQMVFLKHQVVFSHGYSHRSSAKILCRSLMCACVLLLTSWTLAPPFPQTLCSVTSTQGLHQVPLVPFLEHDYLVSFSGKNPGAIIAKDPGVIIGFFFRSLTTPSLLAWFLVSWIVLYGHTHRFCFWTEIISLFLLIWSWSVFFFFSYSLLRSGNFLVYLSNVFLIT